MRSERTGRTINNWKAAGWIEVQLFADQQVKARWTHISLERAVPEAVVRRIRIEQVNRHSMAVPKEGQNKRTIGRIMEVWIGVFHGANWRVKEHGRERVFR